MDLLKRSCSKFRESNPGLKKRNLLQDQRIEPWICRNIMGTKKMKAYTECMNVCPVEHVPWKMDDGQTDRQWSDQLKMDDGQTI